LASPQYNDEGSASRFFYCAKTSRSERNAGLEGFEERALNWSSGEQNPGSFQSEGTNRNATNVHPTVKPISLMRWLVRLVTPPNGIVVDPFCGSGSTGCAAILEGFRFVGIELEAEYVKIAQARLDFWREHGEDALRIVAEAEAAEKERETVKESGQLDMFAIPSPGHSSVTATQPTRRSTDDHHRHPADTGGGRR
jgi:site-specific DNA-methyltransferase (adenine-specific)